MKAKQIISESEVLREKPSEYDVHGTTGVWAYDLATQSWALYYAHEVEERWTTFDQYVKTIKSILHADMNLMTADQKESAIADLEYMQIIAWLPVNTLPDILSIEEAKLKTTIKIKPQTNHHLN